MKVLHQEENWVMASTKRQDKTGWRKLFADTLLELHLNPSFCSIQILIAKGHISYQKRGADASRDDITALYGWPMFDNEEWQNTGNESENITITTACFTLLVCMKNMW